MLDCVHFTAVVGNSCCPELSLFCGLCSNLDLDIERHHYLNLRSFSKLTVDSLCDGERAVSKGQLEGHTA